MTNHLPKDYSPEDHLAFINRAIHTPNTIPLHDPIRILTSLRQPNSWMYLQRFLNPRWNDPTLAIPQPENVNILIYPTNINNIHAQLCVSPEVLQHTELEVISQLLANQKLPVQSMLYFLAQNPETTK